MLWQFGVLTNTYAVHSNIQNKSRFFKKTTQKFSYLIMVVSRYISQTLTNKQFQLEKCLKIIF